MPAPTKYYLRADRKLATEPPVAAEAAFTQFTSNPADPVPYRKREDIRLQFTPRQYMSDDQRFAALRNDVLVFQTQPLIEDLLVTGDLSAHLQVSTTGTDADWVVKLIDVYPDNHPFVPGSQPGLNFGGFQLMVRSEVMRGRFRNSYENPNRLFPGQSRKSTCHLQDVCHTFKKGHRIMVHVQSSWFPLIDRNPQKYVDNIFKADFEDFITATHRVFHESAAASWIELKVFRPATASRLCRVIITGCPLANPAAGFEQILIRTPNEFSPTEDGPRESISISCSDQVVTATVVPRHHRPIAVRNSQAWQFSVGSSLGCM